MKWNSTLYDNKHDFVAEYGKGLLEFIHRNKEQSILDICCVTGILTVQLQKLGSRVVGVDSSREMIECARKQFPKINFQVCDALSLPYEQEWDIIFSNAVFHWINDHDTLLKNIYRALKPKGMLVCEFGAAGNIAAIEKSFSKACSERGYFYQPKFNFETADNFEKILQKKGFIIEKIYDFDRPTVLKDGERGLENWMRQFYATELSEMSEEDKKMVIRIAEEQARDSLWNDREWIADYRRLRVVAYR